MRISKCQKKQQSEINSICWWTSQSYCVNTNLILTISQVNEFFKYTYYSLSFWMYWDKYINDLSIYLDVCPSVPPSVCHPVCPSVCPSIRPFLLPSIHLSASQPYIQPAIRKRTDHKYFLFTLVGNVISHRNYQTCSYSPCRNKYIPRHCNVSFIGNDRSLMKLNRVIIYFDFIHSFIISKYWSSIFEKKKDLLKNQYRISYCSDLV